MISATTCQNRRLTVANWLSDTDKNILLQGNMNLRKTAARTIKKIIDATSQV